jgi:murein DD-endopeptidase MepM/ murein hydrolase activator NlpD
MTVRHVPGNRGPAEGAQQKDGSRLVNRRYFPKLHLAIAGGLSLFLTAFALATFKTEPRDAVGSDAAVETAAAFAVGTALDDSVSASALAQVELPPLPPADALQMPADALLRSPDDAQDTAPEIDSAARSSTLEVRRGDSLSVIFQREGIPARDIADLLAAEPLGKRLRNIFPGHALTLDRDREGRLLKLTYAAGRLETLEFERVDSGFISREVVREPERAKAYGHGVIESSLFLSSQRAGLSDALTMRLAQIFQWDIDFVLDIRRGDEFHVVFEELYVDEEFIGHGNILAAEFVNRGKVHRAIRYTDANGHADYYDPNGQSMRKAFLRAPVEFSRISSNFNLNRVHPLFKRNAPHRGIDYAAPTGTPVLAAGDGRVTVASRTEPNGNYVVIQHGEQFTTKYLHLSKFGRGIRSGTRVRQGQVIGYVGATGWATGPHLHYEFLVNGVHKNPRTVPLPQAEPIPRSEMARFSERTVPLLALLDDYKNQVQLALGR